MKDLSMKTIITALFVATVASTAAFAHSGGTNAAGCHNQTSNGTYHCH